MFHEWPVTTRAFYYARDCGNFGWKSNGKVCFGSFWLEYLGSLLEVVWNNYITKLIIITYMYIIYQDYYSDRNVLFQFSSGGLAVWWEIFVPFSSSISTGLWLVTGIMESTLTTSSCITVTDFCEILIQILPYYCKSFWQKYTVSVVLSVIHACWVSDTKMFGSMLWHINWSQQDLWITNDSKVSVRARHWQIDQLQVRKVFLWIYY